MNLIFFALISLENNNVQQQNLLFISGKKHKILRHEWIQGWNAPLPGAFYCLRYSCSFPSIQDDFPPLLALQDNPNPKDILNLILNDDASTDSDGDVEEL